MNRFFITLCAVLVALASFSLPAAADSQINGYFREGGAISPIQTATGAANWRMVRPDNGEVMYFGECQTTPKGYICRHERLVLQWPGDSGHGQNYDWNGAFPNAQQHGSIWTVRRPDNGATMRFAYCEHRNNGYYCHTEI